MAKTINKDELEKLYNQNILIKDIADYYNCDRNTITRYLQKYGLKQGNSYKPKQIKVDPFLDKKIKIRELYLEGKSCNEIGKIVNLTGRTVNHHLKQMGIAIRSTKKIDQNIFEQLWAENKSDEEIAKFFKVTINTVKSFRTRGENVGKFKQLRYFSQTSQKLSHKQEQFIFGSLLGDLNLTKPQHNRPNSRISIVHCEKQKELFMKKVEILGDFMGNYKLVEPKPDSRTGNVYTSYRGCSKAHPMFTEIYNILYINGVKTITDDFLSKIDSSIAIAYWFMDDGTNRGTLSTNSFSEQEVDLLINWMDEKWEIKCTKQKNLKNFVIHISAKSRLKFEQLIFPHIIPSMYYKLKFLDILQAQSV